MVPEQLVALAEQGDDRPQFPVSCASWRVTFFASRSASRASRRATSAYNLSVDGGVIVASSTPLTYRARRGA